MCDRTPECETPPRTRPHRWCKSPARWCRSWCRSWRCSSWESDCATSSPPIQHSDPMATSSDGSAFSFDSMWSLRAHVESDAHSYKINYFHLLDVITIADWVFLRSCLRPGTVFTRSDVNYRVHHRTVCSISLFRDKVRPEWEDPNNEDGFTVSVRGSFSAEQVNGIWDDLVMEVVREGLPRSIVGIQIARKWIRKMPCVKFDVWSTRNGNKEHIIASLKALLPASTEASLLLVDRTMH